MRGFKLFWFLFGLGLVVDQLVKIWTRGAMPIGGSVHGLPIPGIFELTLTYNKGIAFGLFQGSGVFMTPVALAIAGGAGWYSYSHLKESNWAHAAMGLLAAGALGNLYDRLVHGRVTDMFWFRLINFPVFNVADACITVATVMLMFVWWGDALREKNKAAAPVSEPDALVPDVPQPVRPHQAEEL